MNIPAGQTGRDDLTARVFQAFCRDYRLRTISGTYIVVPRTPPWFAGPSLGDIARQIGDHEHPDPKRPAPGTSADLGCEFGFGTSRRRSCT